MKLNAIITPESRNAVRLTFEKAKAGVPKGLSAGIRAATIFTSSLIKRDVLGGQIVRRVSGKLSRATIPRMDSDFVGVVEWGAEAPYAAGVNYGTRPHIIQAKPGGVLAFTPAAGAIRASAFVSRRSVSKVIRANAVFATVVHHPGTAATNFAETGLAMATPEIRRIVAERVSRGLKGESVE